MLVKKGQPYIELARLHRPTGAILFYFPCLLGTAFLASICEPIIPFTTLVRTNTILMFGCVMIRAFGCTWNDIVDQHIDQGVERTKKRPLPRGAVTTTGALAFAVAQLGIGIGVVLKFLSTECLLVGVPSFLMGLFYPFAKRVTFYPQVVLSIPISWGIVLAFPAMDISLMHHGLRTREIGAIVCLMLACMVWAVIYDTIYTAQDVRDDVKVGVKSTAVRFDTSLSLLLKSLVLVQSSALFAAGYLIEANITYMALSWFGTSLFLGAMVWLVELDDPKDCEFCFKRWNLAVGILMVGGSWLEYGVRYRSVSGNT